MWVKVFGYDARQYLSDPLFYFEQVLRQKLWRWDNFPDDDAVLLDEVPAWLSHYPEFTFIGLQVEMSANGVPELQTDHPLTLNPDISLVKPVDFKTSGWMPRVFKWYEDLRKIAADRIHVPYQMTWWRGGLDLAVQLRGYENLVMDFHDNPVFARDLLAFIVEQRCRWWEEYYKWSGENPGPAFIGDDWVNIPFITPDSFREFWLPRLFDIERFHGGLRQVHSCGNQTPVQHDLLQVSSLKVVEVSPWTDLDQTLKNVAPDKTLWVNFHPNDVLFATPQQMDDKLRRVTDLCRGRSYDISTSGLNPTIETIPEFIEKIRTWTRLARNYVEQEKRPAGLQPSSVVLQSIP